jgi:hypothetical protein
MTLPKPCYIFCFLLMFVSCRRNGAAGGDNASDSLKTISAETKSRKTDQSKYHLNTTGDHSIYGVYELSADSLVLIKRRGFVLQTAKGMHWKWLAKDIGGINEFTADNIGNWWLLQRWKGIHEASYSRLYRSSNKGKTCQRYEFNTNVFFPYSITSAQHQPLQIKTFYNNKVFRLVGSNPQHNWQFLKKLPDEEWGRDVSAGKYFITSFSNKLYTKENGKADTILSFLRISKLYQIEQINNALYITGENKDDGGEWFLVVANKHIINKQLFSRVTITKTQHKHLYVIAEGKPYRFQNGKLISIHKEPEPIRCPE